MAILSEHFFIMDRAALVFLCLVLINAAYTDFVKQKIPNILTFPTMAAGIGYHTFMYGFQGMAFSLAGLATGFGVLIFFHLMNAMGAGDVKLMAGAGAILGAKGVFISFILTAFFGGIYSLVMILVHRRIFKGFFKELFNTFLTILLIKKYDPVKVAETEDKPRLCYGIAIALGTFTYMGLLVSGYEFSF